jgi:CheY-like chemotaxis protein
MNDKKSTPVQIYVVDDDPGHVRLIQKNLRRSGIFNNIKVFQDGASVIEDLQNKPTAAHPILMLLDLNMPGIDGFQVLNTLKANQATKQIPIIVLTTANEPREIQRCYDLGCNLFMTKPMNYEEFAENIRKLGLLFQIVEPPPDTPSQVSESSYA